MSNDYYNLKNGLLFPFQFQVLGYILFLSGLILIIINIWASIIFLFLGAFIISAFSGIEFSGGQFREYNAFFFLKSGKWKRLREVEKIYIKKIKVSQKFYGRANQSSVVRNVIYKAFLKFEDGESVLLYEHKNKNKVESKVNQIAETLKTQVLDYSN